MSIPFCSGLKRIVFAALDRTNLGNARLQGLPQDILHSDPTGVLFDWANSAFFFSYVRSSFHRFDVPNTMGHLYRYPARYPPSSSRSYILPADGSVVQ